MPEENVTLRDVEIFDVGTHNGIPFDMAAVKGLYENTREVMEQVKPYLGWPNIEAPHLGVGHRNKDGTPNVGDELAEKKKRSDLPTLGWMSNLRMRGTKLLADFVDVPRSVNEAIKLGRYRRVSPDVEFNYRNPVSGKRLAAVIKAVRLIGVTPAIKTLKDVVAMSEESSSFVLSLTEAGGSLEGITLEEEKVMPEKNPFEGVKIMSVEDAMEYQLGLIDATDPAVQKELGWDEAKRLMLEGPDGGDGGTGGGDGDGGQTIVVNDGGDSEVATLRAELAQKDAQIAELQGATVEMQDAVGNIMQEKLATERKAAVARLKAEGKLTPAEEPVALLLMEKLPVGRVVEFSEGGKTAQVDGIELVERFVRQRPGKVVEFGERGRGGMNEEGSSAEAQYEAGRKVYAALEITPEAFAEFGPAGRRVAGGVAEFGEDADIIEALKPLVTLLRKSGK